MACLRIHPITGELLNTRAYELTTIAYERMTPEQIEMSEKRPLEVSINWCRERNKEIAAWEESQRMLIKNDTTPYAKSLA